MNNLNRTAIKKIVLMAIALYCLPIFSQFVGINTTTPSRLFHIDAKGNNVAGVTDFSPLVFDDVVIDDNGNMGLGVLSPTAKLHIDSRENGVTTPGFKLVDGTQMEGRALMSDENGFASWKHIDFSGYTVVKYEKVQVDFTEFQSSGTFVKYSGLYIDFPGPGNYLVSIGIRIDIQRPGAGYETWQAQFQPTSNPADWGTSSRFVGSYPVIAYKRSGPAQSRVIMTQQIQIPEDSTRAYLMLTFYNMQYSDVGEIFTSWGNTDVPGEAQRTGGSYVRIN